MFKFESPFFLWFILSCKNCNSKIFIFNLGSHKCDHFCIDSIGSYDCACRQGYQVDNDGRGCVDVDECENDTHRCQNPARCVNLEGTYDCECDSGYNKRGRACYDIDECQS